MAIDATHSVTIRRPIATVFAGLTRVDAWSAWRPGTLGARLTSAGPLGVGATFEQQIAVSGGTVMLIGEIIAYEPPRTLAYRVIAGPLPLTYHYIVEVTADGTRLAVRAEIGDALVDLAVATGALRRELDALAGLLDDRSPVSPASVNSA